MTVATELFRFDDSFARELEGMYDPWHAAPAPEPHLVLLNRELAAELGVDADALATSDGLQVLVVEKRLVLREEVRITRHTDEAHEPQQLTLRREEVTVVRIDPAPPPPNRGKDRAI